jgi:hypothetical protein
VFTTATASNLTAGEEVTLQGGGLPGGFSAQAVYFVASSPAPTATTFSLAATSGGTAIASTSTGSGSVAIPGNVDLYAPQPGSGTLAFWELTFNLTAPAACWHQSIVAGPGTGIAVEEHDGSAIASDPNGIEPISIARWVSASTGVTTDLRHGDVLQSMTSSGTTPVVVPPLNGGGTINVAGCLAGSSFNQSTCFPLTRELYNVMDYYEVVNTAPTGTNNAAFNPVLAGLFVGSGSGLCHATFTIENQGFFPILPNSAFTDACGATANSLRVQMNNAATNG